MHFPPQSAVGREHATCILSMKIKGKVRALVPPSWLGCSSYKALCVTLICSSRRPASDASLPPTICAQFPGSWGRASSESCFPPWQLCPQRCSRAASWGNGQPPRIFTVMSAAWHQGRHQAEMQSGCWYTAEKFYALKYTF